MTALHTLPGALRARLDGLGPWLAPLGLRLILAYEFGEAGLEKLRGENWFAGVQSKFPFPFNHVDPELSWWLATWAELGAAALLVAGLFTRFAAYSLLVLTFVATAAVHCRRRQLQAALAVRADAAAAGAGRRGSVERRCADRARAAGSG